MRMPWEIYLLIPTLAFIYSLIAWPLHQMKILMRIKGIFKKWKLKYSLLHDGDVPLKSTQNLFFKAEEDIIIDDQKKS